MSICIIVRIRKSIAFHYNIPEPAINPNYQRGDRTPSTKIEFAVKCFNNASHIYHAAVGNQSYRFYSILFTTAFGYGGKSTFKNLGLYSSIL